ncbi:hypothetical protein MBLNU459_g7557t1 [Dothideomycetes sp. NU459]
MPRDGSGASDNLGGEQAGHNIVHGDGNASSEVNRSNKAASPPATEKGEAFEGLGASGGGNSAAKGPVEPQATKET